MPVEPISLGIAIGVELLKFALDERNIRLRMAAAGMSQENIDAALANVRAEVAALPSPTALPEV